VRQNDYEEGRERERGGMNILAEHSPEETDEKHERPQS
jgi:hypothetical protein